MTTVIIPYKTNRGFLDECIKSVENQTVDCELIVHKGNQTKGKNINGVLCSANGEFIKILDEDDLLTPNAIEDLENGIKDFDWVCGDAENFGILIDGWADEPFTRGYVPSFDQMIERNRIHGGTTLYRLDALIKIGGWDESLWTAEEYDLHLKLMKNGFKLGYVPKTVYKYRIHGRNKSMNMSPEEWYNRLDYVDEIRKRYV